MGDIGGSGGILGVVRGGGDFYLFKGGGEMRLLLLVIFCSYITRADIVLEESNKKIVKIL